MIMQPLVKIGGQVSDGVSIILMMHKGYDDPIRSIDQLIDMAKKRGLGQHIVDGDMTNPVFRWPVYAFVYKNGEWRP